MFKTLLNIFRVPELRNKVLFTLFMLAIYRIGYHVPILGIDQQHYAEMAKQQSQDQSAAGRLASYVALFSGGNLQQSTVFSLGVMPYISASIIFQLLTTVWPTPEKLQKEGETGRKKIQEWTRYATVPLALLQAMFLLKGMYIQSTFQSQYNLMFVMVALISLTAGCIFLMWLGEQIDEYGLGNGISLIILAGIVARMPSAIGILVQQFSTQGDASHPITPGKIIFLLSSFVFIVAGSILI